MALFRFLLNLQLFADAGAPVNVTTNYSTGPVNPYTGVYDNSGSGDTRDMSPTMKTYYNTELLENARPKLIFTQLGKKQYLPANHGETTEWRKWNTIPKAMKPLTEAVIPPGQKFGMSAQTVSITQHGDYVSISDRLDMHAVDNVILGATEELGAAGGETADTLVRNELVKGTSVLFADTLDSSGNYSSTPSMRAQLVKTNNRLTPDMVNKAYTYLKKNKAPFFEGNKYVAVIHPSVTYDLRSSKDWVEVHKYASVKEIFEGEIGELHGVRFIETTEAPIFNGPNLNGSTAAYLSVTVSSTSGTGTATAGTATANQLTISETPAADLIGRRVHFYDTSATAIIGTGTVVGINASSKYVFLESAQPVALTNGDKLYPGEGGDSTTGPCAVYGTMFFGKDAFGVVDPEGMGMEMIIKNRGQIGGPLEQFSTVGYKFETATKILYEERMVRVESCSFYSNVDEAN